MASPDDPTTRDARPVELYHAPYADGGVASLRRLGQLIDRHNLLLAVMTQLTTGVFLTGYALGLRASSTVIGVLAGLPFLVKVSQLYLSWWIERAGHWRRSTLEGAFLSRTVLLVAAAGPLVAGPGIGAWILVAAVAGSALGATVFEMAFQTWMASSCRKSPAVNSGDAELAWSELPASRELPDHDRDVVRALRVATRLLGNVVEPGGVTVGRMIRVMGRFRSMSSSTTATSCSTTCTRTWRALRTSSREEGAEKRTRP